MLWRDDFIQDSASAYDDIHGSAGGVGAGGSLPGAVAVTVVFLFFFGGGGSGCGNVFVVVWVGLVFDASVGSHRVGPPHYYPHATGYEGNSQQPSYNQSSTADL